MCIVDFLFRHLYDHPFTFLWYKCDFIHFKDRTGAVDLILLHLIAPINVLLYLTNSEAGGL